VKATNGIESTGVVYRPVTIFVPAGPEVPAHMPTFPVALA
jgi:hypothetical protein